MNIITQILIKLIKGYKFFISPLLGQSCRYLPTCSEYSIESLKTFGLAKGTFMMIAQTLTDTENDTLPMTTPPKQAARGKGN